VKSTKIMGCSLLTCKSVEKRKKKETHALTHIASPGRAGRGEAR
jgi:hypothetical protein